MLPLSSQVATYPAEASRSIMRIMTVTVNGEPRELPEGETLRALVARFNLVPEKVAIEWNRRLARVEKYDLPLKDGDEVEIVTFVGGGA
jgi:sulfur carrier protein